MPRLSTHVRRLSTDTYICSFSHSVGTGGPNAMRSYVYDEDDIDFHGVNNIV